MGSHGDLRVIGRKSKAIRAQRLRTRTQPRTRRESLRLLPRRAGEGRIGHFGTPRTARAQITLRGMSAASTSGMPGVRDVLRAARALRRAERAHLAVAVLERAVGARRRRRSGSTGVPPRRRLRAGSPRVPSRPAAATRGRTSASTRTNGRWRGPGPGWGSRAAVVPRGRGRRRSRERDFDQAAIVDVLYLVPPPREPASWRTSSRGSRRADGSSP